MNVNILEINQPDSVFANQSSVCLENIQISNHMSSVYLWKLHQIDEEYSEEEKSSLFLRVNKYIVDFFKIERGKDDEVRNLTRELIKKLRKFVRNIKIDDEKFVNCASTEFSIFHNEIIDFQRAKALEILNSVKNTFRFENKAKRYMFSTIELEYETQVYMTKVIEMKSLGLTSFCELFISTFRPFISDFYNGMEEIIRNYIEKSLNDFEHKCEKSFAKTKNYLHSYLLDIIKSIDPVRITILMCEVHEDSQDFSPWTVCFEKIIDREPIELKQIIFVNENTSIITISFKETNRLMVLFNDSHIISVCEHDLLDFNTLICEGSSREYLVFIHNTLKKSFLAIETNNQLEASIELNLFNEKLQTVISAVLLRFTNEIIFIDQAGHFSVYSIKKQIKINTSEIVPTLYKQIGLSDCGNFIFFVSRTEMYVFTNRCELVLQDFNVPDLVCLSKNKLVMVKVLSDGNLSFSMLRINSEYVTDKGTGVGLTENLGYQFSKALSFGRGMIGEVLAKKYFDSCVPYEDVTK